MTTLTQSQIQVYATSAGMSNPALMAAIAMAESSGSTTVVNSIGCVGLWQINQPVHPQWSKAWLQNPANNAQAAAAILSSQGLTAWEAYTNGAYKRYYQGAATTTSSVTATQANWWDDLVQGFESGTTFGLGGNSGLLSSGGLDGLSTAVTDIEKGAEWVSNPTSWEHVLYVVGGFALLIVGLSIAVKPLTAPITKAIVGAVPKI